MNENARLLAEELSLLGYESEPFNAPQVHGIGDGIKFEYRIESGSRAGETVLLGLAIPDDRGTWAEITPHWVCISPRDNALVEQVLGAPQPGAIKHWEDEAGTPWMAISAPPDDFWDKIERPEDKNMETYLKRHINRIWSTR